MLDIKLIRKDPEWAKKKLAARNIGPEQVDDLLELDEKRRQLLTQSEELKAQRNKVSQQIAQIKREQGDASEQVAAMKQVGKQIKGLDEQLDKIEKSTEYILVRLPNFPDDSVPIGPDESYNVEVRKWQQPREFTFTPKAHWEIGENLGILDFERASKVSGSRFVYYMGMGAKLERAIYKIILYYQTKYCYK